jgi:hypothetical protein
MKACGRTADILNAFLDESLSERHSRHLRSCDRCTDAFTRLDAFDPDIRAAVGRLVREPIGVDVLHAARAMTLPGLDGLGSRPVRATGPATLSRFGMASLLGILVVALLAGIRIGTLPAASPSATASSRPLLPVAMSIAEQALHEAGLRCGLVARGIECARSLPGGWRQAVLLEGSGRTVHALEVRLVPGTTGLSETDVILALGRPTLIVLGTELSASISAAIAADGTACDCARAVDGGTVHVEGDASAGYLLRVDSSAAG